MSAISNMNKARAQNRVSMVRLQYDKQKDKSLMPFNVWSPVLHEPFMVNTVAEDAQQQLSAAARPPAVALPRPLPPQATDTDVCGCEHDSAEDSAGCQQQQQQGHEQQPATAPTHRASALPTPGAHSHHAHEPIRSPSSPLTARRTLTTSTASTPASPVSPRSHTHFAPPWSPRAPAPPPAPPSCPPPTPTTLHGAAAPPAAPAAPAGPAGHAALLGRFSRRSAPDGLSQTGTSLHTAATPASDSQQQHNSCHRSQLEQQQQQREHQHLPAGAGCQASPPPSARPGPRPASARPHSLPASGVSRSRPNGLRVLIPEAATTMCNAPSPFPPSSTAAGTDGRPGSSPQRHPPVLTHPRSRALSLSAPLSPETNRLQPWSSGLLGSFAHSLNRLGSSSLAGAGTVSGGGSRAIAAAAAAASSVNPHDRVPLDGCTVAQEPPRFHRSRTEEGDSMPYFAPTRTGGSGGILAGGVTAVAAGGGSCWQHSSSLCGSGPSDLDSQRTIGLRPSSARNSASGSGGLWPHQNRQQSSSCDREDLDLSLVVARSGPAFTASASGSPLASRRASSGLGGPAPPSGCRDSCSGSGSGNSSGLTSPKAASRPVLHAAANVAATGGPAAANPVPRPLPAAAAAAAAVASTPPVSTPGEEQVSVSSSPSSCHRTAVRQLQDRLSFAAVRPQNACEQHQEQQQGEQQQQSRHAWASALLPAHQPVLTLHAHSPTPLPPGLVLGAAAELATRNARSGSARQPWAGTQE